MKYWEMIEAGNALEAAKELDAHLSEDPEYTGAYYNLGLAFKALGLVNTAAHYFRTYLDIDPQGYHKDRAETCLKELGENISDD